MEKAKQEKRKRGLPPVNRHQDFLNSLNLDGALQIVDKKAEPKLRGGPFDAFTQ